MRFSRPLAAGGRAVAPKHLPRTPAGELHQVTLGALDGEPLMGEGVTEPVRVEVVDPRVGCASTEHLRDPARPHRSLSAEPQVWVIRTSDAEVAVDRGGRLRPDGQDADTRALPHHAEG